jgi:hypothetical protein
MGPVERVLKDAEIKKSDVDEVCHLLVLDSLLLLSQLTF